MRAIGLPLISYCSITLTRSAHMSDASDLRKESALIVDRVKQAMNRDPWTTLPESQRLDHLPALVDTLLPIAFERTDDGARRDELLELARRHGMDRRYQGFEEELILREYYLLRSEACNGLRTFHSERALESVIPQLDAAISEATLASLRGLHGKDASGL